MELHVFLVVMFAAVLHAVWNALVKGGSDKALAMAGVVLGHVPFALVAIYFAPMPSIESLPLLFLGLALHTGYQIVLMMSYNAGDLTQVYPIARGTAPLWVTLVSVAFLGVVLSTLHIVAILLIACGIISIALTRRAGGLRNGKAAGLALITGCFIAAYSLVDGTGARMSGSALGYYAWMSIGNAIIFSVYLAWRHKTVLRRLPTDGRRVFIIGGGASFLAYSLVMWAFTQAPIALVTALRETSIIFALLIGVFVLKERLDLAKVFATAVTLCGVAILRLAK